MKYSNCPICNSDIKHWITKQNEAGLFEIDRCNSCDFAFVNPRPKLDFLMEYYSFSGDGQGKKEVSTLATILENEKKYPNSSVDAKRMLTTVCNFLNKENNQFGQKLLDVGSGYGFFSYEALKRGFEVTAIELATVEREIAIQMTGLKPIAKSFEEFQHDGPLFDVILMSQILEHALDINLWINKAYSILKPNGIISIALPNYMSIFRKVMQSNDPFIYPPAHLNFFSRKSLTLLLSNFGFKVICVQYVSRIPSDSIQNRFKSFGKILPIISAKVVPVLLKGIDFLHLGMIINIYAKKV
jgi:2-polyprenyl-3-methyl-5-hydroxy-6-metoxy-1,4-benzoquinol methylase